MKMFKATTALSIAGVMAAGGAAYSMNVKVLGSSSDTIVPMSFQSPSTNAAPASSPTPANLEIKEVSGSVSSMAYEVGDAGTVMVDVVSGIPVITNIVPNAGWTAEPARGESKASAKVHFLFGATRLEFVVAMVNGAPSVSVKVDNPPSGVPTATSPTSGASTGSGSAGGSSTQRSTTTVATSTKPTMPGSSTDDDDDDDDHDDKDHEDDSGSEHEDDD